MGVALSTKQGDPGPGPARNNMLGSIGNTASTLPVVLPYLWLQLAGCRCGPGPGGVVEVVEVEVEVTRAR